MKFNEIWINEYLALVNDDKPILINENIEFIEQHEHEIIAINDDGEIKIKISLSTKK